mgnify:CR=1 FL=1
MKLTALLAQERREGTEQGREEGINVFYSSLKCKKNPHKLLTSGLWGFLLLFLLQQP